MLICWVHSVMHTSPVGFIADVHGAATSRRAVWLHATVAFGRTIEFALEAYSIVANFSFLDRMQHPPCTPIALLSFKMG